jgi:dienelactone hydrolase
MKQLGAVLISLLFVTFLATFATTAAAEVQGKEVSYQAGGTTLKGYLASDSDSKGQHPGILVVHEWWGLNDYARQRARMLAELGYTALAVDMYGNGKTADHPDDAGKFAGEVRKNMPEAEARFKAAMALLQSQPGVDKTNIAAIGYCFGGGVVLEMARRGLPLKGVASFHGSLPTAHPAQPGQVKAKVLVLNGADDPFTKPEQITAFKQEMHDAGVDLRFINYPGAKHSFTNPQADTFGQRFNLPLQYNEQADRQSWAEMQRFFKRIFQQD